MKTVVWTAAVTIVVGLGTSEARMQPPKKADLLVQVDVTNPEHHQEHAKLSPGIIAAHGGRYLAGSGRALTLEGPPARSRVVVIDLPSFEQAQVFYHSAEYTAARKLREVG